jgi:NAD-dependent histone deacetylase SIR2
MDSSRRATSKTGATSNGTTTTRKTSNRTKNVVDYDEKRHLVDLNEEDDPPAVPNQGLIELEERVNDLGESWETESLFEDALEDLAEDRFFTDGNPSSLISVFSWISV